MNNILFVTIPRVLLGLIFLVSAVDGFYFLATGNRLIHPPVSARGEAFEQALMNAGFFWPLLKVVNLAGALSLIFNVMPALGFALILPVMTVIVLFHLTINPPGVPVAMILVVTGALLLWAYRDRYAALLR